MNNSITKLKDFELDKISGGITAKQKKTLASAIKNACALISGFAAIGLQHLVMRKTHLISKVSEGCTKLFGEKGSDDLGTYYDPTLFSNCAFGFSLGVISTAPSAVACIGGLKLGEWICKKLNLED